MAATAGGGRPTDTAALQTTTVLASFVPNHIVEDCNRRVATGIKLQPRSIPFEGAVVFCDISGFTALTERLAKEEDGAEKLVNFLNNYFGKLVSIINQHGGDVVIFAGDALLAVFRSPFGGATEELRVLTQRATQCAFEVMREMNKVKEGEVQGPRLHIGIGAGVLSLLQVGGVGDSWEFLVCGTPLSQLGRTVSAASPDQTVLSPEAFELVSTGCACEIVEGDLHRLTRITAPLPKRALPVVAPDASIAVALRMFVPRVIQRNTGKTWIVGEMRMVTVLFFNILGVDFGAEDCVESVHAVVSIIQGAVQRYEGVINKLLLDDKGFVIVVGFGLPPLAHEDNALRGVAAAMQARNGLKAKGNIDCSIGITTGKAFCGIVGSETRREYTMIGDVVNTSARLMTYSKDKPNIYVDKPTMTAARQFNHTLNFTALPSKVFKGKAVATEIFTPSTSSGRSRKVKSIATMARMNINVIGRNMETMMLGGCIDQLVSGGGARGGASAARGGGMTGRGAVVILEAAAGVGKSRLVEEAKRIALEAGANVYCGCGEAVEKGTAFHPWRAVFAALFEISEEVEEGARDIVLNLLHGPLLEKAALLNAVLPLEIEESETTRRLVGRERLEATTILLMTILKQASQSNPTVVILEDLHYMDALSRELLVAVGRALPDMLTIVSTRPFSTSNAPAQYQRLLQLPAAIHIKLKMLSNNDITEVVCKRLGTVDLPPLIKTLVVSKCGGNPFYAEELAQALKESGVIEVNGIGCALAPGINSVNDIALPETLQGVITSRLDKLSPTQMLTLKVASAIGREFDPSILFAVYPLDGQTLKTVRGQISDDLVTLQTLEVVMMGRPSEAMNANDSAPGTGAIFSFVTPMTHEVVYSLMLAKQRTELHHKIAEWYETHDPERCIAQLVYHWRNAGVKAKAVYYVEQSAAVALVHGLREEAVAALQEGLELCDASAVGVGQRVRLNRLIADAFNEGAEFDNARQYATAALAALEITGIDPTNLPALLWKVREGETKYITEHPEVHTFLTPAPMVAESAITSRKNQIQARRRTLRSDASPVQLPKFDDSHTDATPPPRPPRPAGMSERRAAVNGTRRPSGPEDSNNAAAASAAASVNGAAAAASGAILVRPARSGVMTRDTTPSLFQTDAAGWRVEMCVGIADDVDRTGKSVQEMDVDMDWYRNKFMGNEHVNYAGYDTANSPVIISVTQERMPNSREVACRVLLRNPDAVRATLIPAGEIKGGWFGGTPSVKDVLKVVAPELPASCLTQAKYDEVEQDLLELEEKLCRTTYKVGVVHCRAGMTTEDEVLTNDEITPEFDAFLRVLGDRVTLKGFTHFAGGLDTDTDATGTHSVHSLWGGYQVMFHVSPLIPRAPDVIERKRLVAGDTVLVVYLDPGVQYNPNLIHAKQNHVIMLAQAATTQSGAAGLRLHCAARDAVPEFGPHLGGEPIAFEGPKLRSLILTKLINGERAAANAPLLRNINAQLRRLVLEPIVARATGKVKPKKGLKRGVSGPLHADP